MRGIRRDERIERPLHVLALGAEDAGGLRREAEDLLSRLSLYRKHPLPDFLYTVNSELQAVPQRAGIVTSSFDELDADLRKFLREESSPAVVLPRHGKGSKEIAFLFTGQGSQYSGMGKELFETQPAFRRALLECNEILRNLLDLPLLEVMYPEGDSAGRQALDETMYAQPAVFSLEYALAELWKSWGVEPSAVTGHSLGEYAAACTAGVMSLEDSLRAIAAVGRLTVKMERSGAVAVVMSSEENVAGRLQGRGDTVSIAAVNTPGVTVVSGDAWAVEEVLEELTLQGIQWQKLPVSHAFHSSLIEVIMPEYYRTLKGITFHEPRIPMASTVTGGFVDREIAGPGYWRDHLRRTVRFSDAVAALYGRGFKTFLEVGPARVLLGMTAMCLSDPGILWASSIRPGQSSWTSMTKNLSRLYVNGIDVNWRGFDRGYRRRFVSLRVPRRTGKRRIPGNLGPARSDGAARGASRHARASRPEPIAVVGMGCRMPGGVDGLAEFWDLLRDCRDAVGEVPSERWDIEEYYDPDPEIPGKMYTRWGGFLRGLDRFDPFFFGMAPVEALTLDPQQRLVLEVAWEAVEDAAIDPQQLSGTYTSVFVGVYGNDHYRLLRHAARDEKAIDAYIGTGNTNSMVSGRLSYILGLQGPSVSVDTACSSSLTAVHLACRSLRMGESALALAGGVNVILSPETTITLCRMGALSASGRCRAFDAKADGFTRSEACGMIVLKRLEDARRDGDRIHALILGSASNQDGRSAGLTVPRSEAQIGVIEAALRETGVEPCAVSYVEAHGTGTPVGDPAEFLALAETLGKGRGGGCPSGYRVREDQHRAF